MKQADVLAVCGDPGGAAALAPVLALMESERRLSTVNFAYLQGIDVLASHGIPCFALPTEKTADAADEILRQTRARFLLTATSHNALNWEKAFIAAARQRGLPSLSVLDYWSNYTLRFSDAPSDLCFLPDKVAVMDPYAKAEMLAEGFPEERLLVTGQPAFDSLPLAKTSFLPVHQAAIRERWKVEPNGLLVVFNSQPLRMFYGNPGGPASLGFDEQTVIAQLIDAMESLSETLARPLTLVIRPHPRENLSSYARYHSSRIRLIVSREEESRAVMMASDLVVGMNSVVLVEACLLGCAVLSLQPGLQKPDTLPTNRWGSSEAVYETSGVFAALQRLLGDESSRLGLRSKTLALQNEIPLHGSQNVVAYIYGNL